MDSSNFIRFQSIYSMSIDDCPIVFVGEIYFNFSFFRIIHSILVLERENTSIRGISSWAVYKRGGIVRFGIITNDGEEWAIETKAPNAWISCLSIQKYCQEQKLDCKLIIDSYYDSFYFPVSVGNGNITFDLVGQGNLPKSQCQMTNNKNKENKKVLISPTNSTGDNDTQECYLIFSLVVYNSNCF